MLPDVIDDWGQLTRLHDVLEVLQGVVGIWRVLLTLKEDMDVVDGVCD